ncbi:MAG: transposase [Candidatus Thermoplasmatota archaeon]
MESGRSRRTGHISKRGSAMLMDALCNAALPASRSNSPNFTPVVMTTDRMPP